MKIKDLSICFHTTKIEECKAFYTKYFNCSLVFDYEWYAVLAFPKKRHFLSFMIPQDDTASLFQEKGITLNLMVDDVDAEYEKLKETDINIVVSIANQPWGDRSFRVVDPIGNILYIYSNREPEEEYKQAIK